MARPGRPPLLSQTQRAILAKLVEEGPVASMDELRSAFETATGIRAHGQTLEKYLRLAGVERRRDGASISVETTRDSKARYGDTEAHRRLAPEQRYPSSLTDAEWDLVKDIFDSDGGRGKPPRYPRRQLVDAWEPLINAMIALAKRVSNVQALDRAGQI